MVRGILTIHNGQIRKHSWLSVHIALFFRALKRWQGLQIEALRAATQKSQIALKKNAECSTFSLSSRIRSLSLGTFEEKLKLLY